MLQVDDATMLAIWEQGRALTGTARPVTLLAVADPGRSRREIAELPLGRRDALLLELRRAVAGPRLDCLVDCPACGLELEIGLDTDELIRAGGSSSAEADADGDAARDADIDAATGADAVPERHRIRLPGVGGAAATVVEARLPISADLEALAMAPDAAAARRALVDRCVQQVGDGAPSGSGAPALGEAQIVELGRRLDELDPLADVRIDVRCGGCGVTTDVLLDIADLVWEALSAGARQLVVDVDVLAARYGWAEADILAMTAARRRLYRELW